MDTMSIDWVDEINIKKIFITIIYGIYLNFEKAVEDNFIIGTNLEIEEKYWLLRTLEIPQKIWILVTQRFHNMYLYIVIVVKIFSNFLGNLNRRYKYFFLIQHFIQKTLVLTVSLFSIYYFVVRCDILTTFCKVKYCWI